jgi:hypothetical protein
MNNPFLFNCTKETHEKEEDRWYLTKQMKVGGSRENQLDRSEVEQEVDEELF